MNIQMDRVLEAAIRQEASDIHLRVGKPPTLVIDGALRPLTTPALSKDDLLSCIKQIAADKPRVEVAIMDHPGGADFAIQWEANGTTARFRVSAFREQGQHAATLRRLPSRIMTPEEIGLPPEALELALRSRGVLFITGPTGSGKTTTLATIVTYIARARPQHILTIEEPTEYRFASDRSIITQREVPDDVATFNEGLTQGLRQAPNTIMIGEMRDLETMEVAIRAAETGHLVLATLHTVSAAKTVDRVIESFPEGKQAEMRIILSTSLLGVLGQQLVRRADGKGRVAVFEFMVNDSSIGNLIRERKTNAINDRIQTSGSTKGMRLLDDQLYNLVVAGTIEAAEAFAKANAPDKLKERLARQAPRA